HHDALVAPKIKEHRGRIVRTIGDGLLVVFASVVDALRCAVEVQCAMARRNAGVPPERRIQFRIGINFGDIIIDGRDVHGDGVNVAARLEALAEPGGICVSGRVREDVQSKFDIAFEDAGEQQLKNILHPVKVYRVRVGGPARNALPLANKSSIPIFPAPDHDKVNVVVARHPLSLRLFVMYTITPVIVLLLAHYIIIMKLDLNTVFFRVFSLLLPIFVGFVLFQQTRWGLGAALLSGASTGIISVLGMLAIVRFIDSDTFVPSTLFEWQEAVEYAVGITFATMIGNVVARATESALSSVRRH